MEKRIYHLFRYDHLFSINKSSLSEFLVIWRAIDSASYTFDSYPFIYFGDRNPARARRSFLSNQGEVN